MFFKPVVKNHINNWIYIILCLVSILSDMDMNRLMVV